FVSVLIAAFGLFAPLVMIRVIFAFIILVFPAIPDHRLFAALSFVFSICLFMCCIVLVRLVLVYHYFVRIVRVETVAGRNAPGIRPFSVIINNVLSAAYIEIKVIVGEIIERGIIIAGRPPAWLTADI